MRWASAVNERERLMKVARPIRIAMTLVFGLALAVLVAVTGGGEQQRPRINRQTGGRGPADAGGGPRARGIVARTPRVG